MEFNSKLNNIKIGEKNSDEQENEIKKLQILMMHEMKSSNFIKIILQ